MLSTGKLYGSAFRNSKLSHHLLSSSTWKLFESSHGNKIRALPEVRSFEELLSFLERGGDVATFGHAPRKRLPPYKHDLSRAQYLLCLDAAMATFSLHVHARIASLVGSGFYTIGPCGEELLSAAALALKPEDTTALHYRHTGMSLARQLHEGKQLNNLLLNRARGYTVSKHDPVTGGVHCSIGDGPNEYLVTSTLSSQCPAAVGRALGFSLLENKDGSKPISFATIGDGSLHNHHFLSAFTLARHAKHLKVKCPMVFGISNNGLSISYETKNFVDSMFEDKEDPLIPVFRSDGQDMLDVYDQTRKACDYARKHQSPCIVLYSNLIRRFGHAATDRQYAYLGDEEIQNMAGNCVLKIAMQQAVEELGFATYSELYDRLSEIHHMADQAFSQATQEPKVTLEDMMSRVSAPLASLPRKKLPTLLPPKGENKPQVMRKNMNRCFHEILQSDPSVVYLGEDVRHGGYYLVTEDLAKDFPTRVLDFPPDETTLLGAALGFAQLGLTPIVEIPYAKYLDCGVDMFYEIAIQHWLSCPKKKKKTGMIIRLQGFDRGLFGGNFHTHNMLNHIPPGVDVICFSNGRDYVKGMRHAVLQAKAGRVVMIVDCTHLLNLRHIHDRDRAWEFPYPGDKNDLLTFHDIRRYKTSDVFRETAGTTKVAIVSYGNGVVTSLKACRALRERGVLREEVELDVIDCPYLSGVPSGLKDALKDYQNVVFADICKEGPGSNVFSSMIVALQGRGLPQNWVFLGAPRTYNPLGSTVTFLNETAIENAIIELLQKDNEQQTKHDATCTNTSMMDASSLTSREI
mmetsp:Transcript_4283/g.6144  ORF Transcript_4283/g.6144 Transcript_4283/m.6144 type:complete len:802 (+) Transcript_4283:222-2627(+)